MDEISTKDKIRKWYKRFGMGGIIFFTVKGCISLYLILMAGKCALE